MFGKLAIAQTTCAQVLAIYQGSASANEARGLLLVAKTKQAPLGICLPLTSSRLKSMLSRGRHSLAVQCQLRRSATRRKLKSSQGAQMATVSR